MIIGFETETVEFKKSTSELREGIVSVASMLNKHGHGLLYFGVRNDGEAVGQQIGDRTLRDISQMIASSIRPQVIPTITIELLDDKNIIKVEFSGSEKPYSAFGRYYMRSADEDRELSPAQLAGLMQERDNADIISVIKSERQSLTFGKLKALYAAEGLTVNEDTFARNLGLLNGDGDYNLMAELLADENDVSVKVVTFAGTDKSRILLRKEYGFKCLAIAMDNVLNYMESINATAVTLTSHQRIEENLFDFAAFKEAWQNACLHTKWQLKNPPAVYIYSDRIEIISTGGLPGGLTKEEFFRGISKPVNMRLQKIFGQLGFVEQTGHGIPLIISRYGIQAFEVMDNFINVTIPFNPSVRSAYPDSHGDRKVVMNEAQQSIYDFLRSNPDATVDNMTGSLDYSNSYIRKNISWLKENNLLERVGSNKTGYWSVK